MHSLEYRIRTSTKISEHCNINPQPSSQMCFCNTFMDGLLGNDAGVEHIQTIKDTE